MRVEKQGKQKQQNRQHRSISGDKSNKSAAGSITYAASASIDATDGLGHGNHDLRGLDEGKGSIAGLQIQVARCF